MSNSPTFNMPTSPSGPASSPPKCIDGCGFFGNPSFANRCSKCHKDFLDAQETQTKAVEQVSTIVPSQQDVPLEPCLQPLESSSVVAENNSEEPEVPVQKNMKRCWTCNKKHGVLGFKCRCGFVFCDQHRHGTDHGCTYDGWKEDVTQGLQKKLIKVQKNQLNGF